MSRGVNKVIIIGNLGADPEMRTMPNGEAVTNISVATSENWTDKNTGEPRERTEWHRIVAYRRLAEIIGQYLRKGSKVYIEGRLQTRKWQDQNGTDRYTTEIIADNMQMLDSRSGGTAAYPNEPGDYRRPDQSRPTHNQAQASGYQNPPTVDQQYDDGFSDDDIPF